MVEPQWNPAVEEQAIARALRMGQTRPVTVVRYMVKNSIEEVSEAQASFKVVSYVRDRTFLNSSGGSGTWPSLRWTVA